MLYLSVKRRCLHADVDMDKICLTARASARRGLAGIQREVQDLMRFMIRGGGGFLICEEKVPACWC